MGVDLHPASWDAVEWAAAEAEARHHRLLILHVIESTGSAAVGLDGFGLAYVALPDADTEDQARRTLAEATRRARQIAPGLDVVTELELGDPASLIARSGRKAELIALGGGSTSILDGDRKHSTSWRVARRATRPVALVDLAHSHVPGPLVGHIAVAIDPTRDAPIALEMAFQAARQRGLGVAIAAPMTVLSDNTGRAIAGPAATTGPPGSREGWDALQVVRESFPEVDVTCLAFSSFSDGRSAPDLAGAALLVVGAGTRWLRRAVVDSVGDSAVRAACGSTVLLTWRI